MKDVLISLKPYYYYLIGEGIKEVEVRKSYPKAEDWSRNSWFYMSRDEKSFAKIPKEFQEKYRKHFGKVGMRFVCDRITEYECSSVGFGELATTCGTCLTYDEILNYCNGNDLYGLHITDLVVYDKPRELGEFKRWVDRSKGQRYHEDMLYLQSAPQSWCYIEPRKTAD